MKALSLVLILFLRSTDAAPRTRRTQSASAEDRMAIERLHPQDISAILSGKPDDFAHLCSENAVRMEPDTSAEVGKATIYRDAQEQAQRYPDAQTLTYKTDIKNLKMSAIASSSGATLMRPSKRAPMPKSGADFCLF